MGYDLNTDKNFSTTDKKVYHLKFYISAINQSYK